MVSQFDFILIETFCSYLLIKILKCYCHLFRGFLKHKNGKDRLEESIGAKKKIYQILWWFQLNHRILNPLIHYKAWTCGCLLERGAEDLTIKMNEGTQVLSSCMPQKYLRQVLKMIIRTFIAPYLNVYRDP